MANSSRVDLASKITRARIRLALRQPFLASALMRLPLVETRVAWCATMATDGYFIFYNPAWVARLSDPELRGVIAHELLHVIFGHAARIGARDPALWNVACDHAINLILHEQGFRLPKGGLLDRSFVGMTAEEIYEALGKRRKSTSTTQVHAHSPVADDGETGVLMTPERDLFDPRDPRLSAIRPADSPDAEQIRNTIEELRETCRQQLRGDAAAWFGAECARASEGEIDWRTLLRAWLYDRLRCDWSLWPANKKHIHRGLILPSVGAPAPGHLVFAVDTSRSMTNEQIAAIYEELALFRETFPCRLTVLQVDVVITSREIYEAEDGAEIPERVSIVGRGGTDFRAVFEQIDLGGGDGDDSATALIFATDGFGTFPERPPSIPVLWLRTATGLGTERFPFGAVHTLRAIR